MNEISIVPYEPKWRSDVRRCVFETGFGGEPVAPYFEDAELFADIITLYYTEHEPENAYVPLVDGEPAGYLLGCVDTARHNRIVNRKVHPEILRKLLTGCYRNVGPVTRRYLYRIFLQLIRGESITPPIDLYPAHLHIDLFKPYRRLGIGSRLINTFLDSLREKGIPGVHLGTSSFHTEGLPFYEKLGFTRHSMLRVTSSYFQEVSDRDLYDICFVKRLA